MVCYDLRRWEMCLDANSTGSGLAGPVMVNLHCPLEWLEKYVEINKAHLSEFVQASQTQEQGC